MNPMNPLTPTPPVNDLDEQIAKLRAMAAGNYNWGQHNTGAYLDVRGIEAPQPQQPQQPAIQGDILGGYREEMAAEAAAKQQARATAGEVLSSLASPGKFVGAIAEGLINAAPQVAKKSGAGLGEMAYDLLPFTRDMEADVRRVTYQREDDARAARLKQAAADKKTARETLDALRATPELPGKDFGSQIANAVRKGAIKSLSTRALLAQSADIIKPEQHERDADFTSRWARYVDALREGRAEAPEQLNAGSLAYGMEQWEKANPDLPLDRSQKAPRISSDDAKVKVPFRSGFLDYMQEAAANADRALSDPARNPYKPGTLQYYGYNMGQSGLQYGAGIAVGLATRNPTLAAAVIGVPVAGEAYADARAAGADPDTSLGYATLYGLAEMLPERMVIKGLINSAGKGFVKGLAKNAASEGLQEGVTEILQTALDQGFDINADPNMTARDFFWKVADASITGALMGAGAHTAQHAITAVQETDEQTRERFHNELANFLSQAGQNAAAQQSGTNPAGTPPSPAGVNQHASQPAPAQWTQADIDAMKAADPANSATIQAQYDALTDSSVPPAGQQGAAQSLAATWQAQQAAQQAANLPPSPGGGGAGGGVSQQASQPAGTPVQNTPPSQWTQADVDALKAANPAFANNLQLLFDAANDQSVPDSTRADAAQQLAAAWQATQSVNPPTNAPNPAPAPAVNPPSQHGTSPLDQFDQAGIDAVRGINQNDAARIEGIQNALKNNALPPSMAQAMQQQLATLAQQYAGMTLGAQPAANPAPTGTPPSPRGGGAGGGVSQQAANANTANPTQPAPANGAQGGTTYSAAPAAQSPVGWGLPHQNAPAQGVPGNVGASSGSVTPAVLPPPPQRSAAGESWGGGSASNGTTGAATYSPPPANTQGQSVAPANAATPPSPGGSTPNSAAGQANPTPAPSPTGGGVNGSAPSYTTAQPGSAISQQELDELKRDLPQQAQKIQDLYDATTDQALPQEGRDGAQQSLDAIRQQATANHRANIDRAALEAHLRRVLGADLARRIRFDGIMADGSVLTQEGAADADGSIVLNLDVIQAYIVDGKTIQSREQRAALVAWHELYHRGEAVYGATPPGAQAYRDMIARMYQNPALRSLAEAIQAERAAAVAQGADPRILIDHETAMREALAEVAGALESGAGVDYLTQRYADFAIPRQHIPALGRLLQKGARLLRKIAGKLRGRAYTEQQLSDAEAYRLFASVNQLRGADMPGQNPQPVGAGSVTAQNAGQNAGTPPSPGGGGAGGGVSSQAANANTANPPANNPPGANPQGAAPNPLNPQAQRQAPASGVVYSASPQTIANYEQRIDDLYDGKAEPKRRGGVRVLDNSDMLGMLGLGKLPVILAEGKVNAEKHPNTTREVWKKVPGWLDNPALVFDSATEAGRLVFIAPEKVAGEPVRMVLEPAHGGMTVNVLVNTYDQDANNDAIDRWLKPEQKTRTKTSGAQKTQWRTPLRYYDTQKARLVLTVGQQQSLRTVIESGAGAEPHVYDTRFQPRASSRGMPILNELNLKSYRDSGQTVTPKTATDHSALLNPEAVENETTENTGETTPQESTPPEADRTTYSTAPQFEETARQNGGEAAYEQAKAAGKTNLTYRQWVQVRTPAFKAWFGDWENNPAEASKVIDPQTGEPLIMYHGTSQSQNGKAFDVFDTYGSRYGLMGLGSYFTANHDVAQSYTTKGRGDLPRVYAVHLDIRNPIDMDAAADPAAWAAAFDRYGDIAEYLEDDRGTNESYFRAAESMLQDEMLPTYEGAEIMQNAIMEMGYDGVTHIGGGRYNKQDDTRHRVYIAFHPNQIKSATDNSGAFDAGNDNIRYSVPPALQEQLDRQPPAHYGALANAFATYEAAGYEAARDALIQWAEEHYAGQGLGAMRRALDGYHQARQANPDAAITVPPATLSDSEAQHLADFMAGIPARAQEAAAQKREMDARAAAGLPLLYSAPPVPSQLASERLATIRESGGRRAYDEAAKRGRTVLSYHDWLTVRSPSFKAWFGDWQAGESSRAVHPRTGEPLKVYLRRAAPGYMTFTDKANPRAAFAGFIRVDNDASGGVWAVFDRNQLMPAPEPVPPTPSAAQPAYSTAPQERVSRFAQAVDAIANGTPAASRYIRLGTTTPEALQLSGLPNVPIDIESAVIRKVMNENIDNGHGHNLTAEELEKLPRSLNRPIAVLRSNARSTNPDGYIVLTELVEEDILTGEKKPVVASLFLRDVRDGLQITRITSVYGKWKSQINNALQHDPIKYWDKEKGPQFLTSLRLQLPTRLRSDANLRRANIKTNEDLSQDGLRDDAPLYSTAPAALAAAYSVPPWELRAEPPTRAALRQRILDWFADPDRQDKWFDNQGELERIMKAHPGNTLAEAVRNSYKTYNAKVQRDIERELKPQFDAIAARLGAEYKRLRQSVPMYRGLSTADGMNLFMEHLDKIGKYIYHGRERNLEIAIRTGGQDMAGSGRTDAEIAEVEAFFNQPEHGGGELIRLYDDLYQNQLKKVMDAADAKLRAAGLLTPEMEAARPQYRYYIPLYGKPELEDPALSANINDSFSARTGGNTMTRDTLQNRTHNAGGRHGTEAHNLFETIFTQAEIAIRRAQMQEPKRRLWDFLQTAEGIAAFDAQTQSHTIGAGNTNPVNAAGQLTWQTAATAPNQIVWQDGNQIHIMTIGNARALNAVRNFNQPAFPYDGDPSKQPGAAAYHAVGWATRFMGSMYTRFNPSFILRNKVMDSLQQWQLLLADAPVGNMTTAKGVQGYLEAAGNVAGRMGLVMNAMKYNILWTGSIGKNSEYQQWLERYAAQGGVTSYATFLGRDSLLNLSRAAWKEAATAGERARHPGDALTWGGKLLDGLNNLAEMTTRVSAFRALVEAGVSEERAANYVKDIMNFETKGENARHANALYPFFTTSLYDARRLFKVLSKKEGQVVFTALVGFSYVLWATIAAATGDDEDGVAWVDKYPMGIAARYAIIPIRSDDGKMRGEGIRIPLGFGLGRLANTVALSLRRFMNGTDNTGELISNLVNHAAIGSFSPLQPSDVNISKDPTYWLWQTFIPQVGKPALQYASNKNWRGMPIYNSDQYRSDGDLDYNTGMETTPDVFKTIAEKWYDATGYDVAPESLAHWYNAALGGLGADMAGVAETILDQTGHGNKSAASWYKAAPVIGGFVQGAPTEDRERYYAYRDAVKDGSARYINAAMRGKNGDRYQDDVYWQARFDAVEKQLQRLRKQRKQLRQILTGDERQAMEREYNDAMLNLQRGMVQEFETQTGRRK